MDVLAIRMTPTANTSTVTTESSSTIENRTLTNTTNISKKEEDDSNNNNNNKNLNIKLNNNSNNINNSNSNSQNQNTLDNNLVIPYNPTPRQPSFRSKSFSVRARPSNNIQFKQENIQSYTDANGVMYKVSDHVYMDINKPNQPFAIAYILDFKLVSF